MEFQRRVLEATIVGVVVVLSAYLVFPYNKEESHYFKSDSREIPAIFNFGDSNSDTGSYAAAFGSLLPPYGVTHFGEPRRRSCDGRLIIDFIAERLKLPYLVAYLDSTYGPTDYKYGANFATAGSTIQHLDVQRFKVGANPISLDVQVTQFEQFKARYGRGELVPIAKALFTIDHGQNDILIGLGYGTTQEVIASIPNILDDFSTAFERLYNLGARAFWIHNTGPSGCMPFFLNMNPPEPNNTDPIGCIKSYNEVCIEFNKQLKNRISELKNRFELTRIFYIDIYSIKYALISQGKQNGFPANPLGCCCWTRGGNFGQVMCDEKRVINGSVVNEYCSTPSDYINWDSIHNTEAANEWIVDRIFNGSFSELPEFPWLNVQPVNKES